MNKVNIMIHVMRFVGWSNILLLQVSLLGSSTSNALMTDVQMSQRIQRLKRDARVTQHLDNFVNYKKLKNQTTVSASEIVRWKGFSCYGKRVFIMTDSVSLQCVDSSYDADDEKNSISCACSNDDIAIISQEFANTGLQNQVDLVDKENLHDA